MPQRELAISPSCHYAFLLHEAFRSNDCVTALCTVYTYNDDEKVRKLGKHRSGLIKLTHM